MYHISTMGRLFFSSIASLPAPDSPGLCYCSQHSASDTWYCSCSYGHEFYFPGWRMECRVKLLLLMRGLLMILYAPKLSTIIYSQTAQMNKSALSTLGNCQY